MVYGHRSGLPEAEGRHLRGNRDDNSGLAPFSREGGDQAVKLWATTRKCLNIIKQIGGYGEEEFTNYCIVSWFALRLPQLASDMTLDLNQAEQRKLSQVAQSLAERQTRSSERIGFRQKTENLAEWELAVLHEQVGFLSLRLNDLIDASSVAALQRVQGEIHKELLKRSRLRIC
jgi:hypothetical protein